jgi:ring-1,2-phenylacetyl-CoA epoxidase subunit PaaE
MLTFHPLVIRRREHIATDAIALTLEVPDSYREAYRFACGQHVAVRAVIGGRELRRTYSIVSPEGGTLRLGVRVQGQMSRYLAETVRVGDTLDVMTPSGRFHPQDRPGDDGYYVAFAAGSGITPVLSVVTTLLEQRAQCRITLFYGNRDTARTMFSEDVLALKNRFMDRIVIHFLMTLEPQDAGLFNGRLDRDRIAALAGAFFEPQAVDEYFVCGPSGMIEGVIAALKDLGGPGRIHAERFMSMASAPADSRHEASNRLGIGVESSTEVIVQLDGRRRAFRMPADDVSLLEAAERAGLELPFSCRDGICSTCRVRVIEGRTEMKRNQSLEPWEVDAGFVLCCQARPITPRVVLSYDEK